MSPRTGNFTVELEGRGALIIRPSDHIATGGEASVYRAHGTSVKIYTDTEKMRRDGMIDKVKLLKPLRSKFVMAPEGIVFDSNGKPIGLYMPFAEGEALPRIFTSAYWQREGFEIAQANTLVDRMRDTVRFAHDHKAVMVDPNELNWVISLARKKDPEPRAIDVDSWAIGRFGPKAIMLSIKDWHAKGFNDQTDWFAWGIVTFQIFTGIHPYRGTLDGYTQKDLEKRMKDNASVFAKGVRLNNAVRDFSTIPVPLFEWYKATFEKNERTIPPSPFDKGIAAVAPAARIHKTVTTASGALIFDKLFEKVGDAVLRTWPCGVVQTASGTLVEIRTKHVIGKLGSQGEVVKVDGGWLLADPQSSPAYTFVDERTRQEQALSFSLKGLSLFRYENRLFLVTESELVELKFMGGGNPLVVIGPRTQILQPRATKWFDGIGVQKAFDATFMVLPFGDAACITVRAKELDHETPIIARAGSRFASVITLDKKGTYHKHEFIFDKDYRAYQHWQDVVDSPELNLAILPHGVTAMILDDGELVIFVPSNGKIHKVKDRMIEADMVLTNWEEKVVYVKDGALWSVKMK